MAQKRLYKCQRCSMIYWGHELKPGNRSFPVKLSGAKCPTPGCGGNVFTGQATPGETSIFSGILAFVIALCVLHWIFKLGWLLAAGVAIVLGVVVILVSRRLHQPRSAYEDQEFAANELAHLGERLHQTGRLKEARWAFERAAAILEKDTNLKLEGAIIGHLGNVEKEMADFSSARKHYDDARAIAEKIGDISGVINRLNNIAALLGDDLHNQDESIGYLERALKLAREFGDPARLAQILVHFAKRQREAGDYTKAHSYIEEALSLSHETGHSEIIAESLYERASIAIAEDRKTDAVPDLEEAGKLLRFKDSRGVGRRIKQTLDTVNAAIRNNKPVQILPPGKTPREEGEPDPLDGIPADAFTALHPGIEHGQAGRLALAADCLYQALQQDCVKNSLKARAVAGMNLGDILRQMGRVDEALEILHEALAWSREAHTPYIECGILLNLAIALHVKGLWADSRTSLEEAVKLVDQLHYESIRGRILKALGDIHRDSRDYEIAERHYQQAEECARLQHDSGLHGAIRMSKGNMHFLKFRQSRWQAIQTYDEKAKEAASENLEMARQNYEKALEFARQTRDAILQGIALHMLGTVHRWLGHPEQALELHQESIAMARSTLSELGLAGRLNAIGTSEQQMSYLDKAREHYQQAVEIYRKHGIASPDVAGCLENLGVLLVRMGETTKGCNYMLSASAMDNKMVAEAFTIASEDARIEFLEQAESRLNDLVSLVARGGPSEDDRLMVQKCAEAVIRRKGAALEALAIQREVAASGSHPELAELLRELAQVRMQLAQLNLSGYGVRWDGTLTDTATELADRRRRLEQRIGQHLPSVYLDEKLRSANRQAVALHLPEGSVLIEFLRFNFFSFPPPEQEAFWSPARYAAFVLPALEPDKVQLVDLGEATLIDKLIAIFRSSITGEAENRGKRDLGALATESRRSTITCDGAALREAVFAPLLAATGGSKRLLLAPDGDLTRLPFEVLPTENGRYLIDDYDISYLGVGRDALRFGSAITAHPASPLIVADPDFDLSISRVSPDMEAKAIPGRISRDLQRSRLHFERLPSTRVEGEHIASMLGMSPWLGGKALEARIKTYHSPAILHLATHGFFLEDQKTEPNMRLRDLGATGWQGDPSTVKLAGPGMENPLLRSGLSLAGANTWLEGGTLPEEAEDGILTAEDVSGLDLLNTELVVLSACETGLGEAYTGEGVFGLRRAFILAGAKTLVMSLWKVPDQETQELMENYYLLVLEGQSRAEALHNAQLKIRDKYPDPFYWGAFICQGDAGPLPIYGGPKASS